MAALFYPIAQNGQNRRAARAANAAFAALFVIIAGMAMIDLRAREVAAWRKKTRALADELASIERIAAANDRMLLALHDLAVILAGKKTGAWRQAAQKLLCRRLGLAFCGWRLFAANSALARQCARLPAGGAPVEQPAMPAAGASHFFHLPLRNGKKTVGVAVLGGKRPFAANAATDFTRRLAALLAAAEEGAAGAAPPKK